MANLAERGQISSLDAQQKHSTEFLDTLKRELALTAETLAVQLTELRVMGFQEALGDMTPKALSLGFRRCRRTSRSFPRPADVRGAAEIELEIESKRVNAGATIRDLQATPHCSEWTEEERRQFVEDIRKACEGKFLR